MNYDRADLLDRLAAAYVFGAMSARVRRRFQTLQHTLPAARQAVHLWEQRLTPLANAVPPVQPPAQVWAVIAHRTGDRAAQKSTPSSTWLTWFKPLLGVAFGVFITLGLVRLYPTAVVPVDEIVQERGTLPASYVGLLTDAAGNPVVLASSTRHGKTMSIKILRKLDVPEGKILQLWAIPVSGAPFPLGVVPAEGKGAFQMADSSEKLLSNVPRLAVSFEDAPAQTGATPATYVLTGNCVKLW
jgi:anti-sigma-K factor RskA